MFSGYLMASVYHLEGVHGYRGWQWLFIINTVISLPIAISGFFFMPDFPENTRVFYLNDRDKLIARKRMQLEGRVAKRSKNLRESLLNTTKLRKFFSSWHIYALTLLYIFFNNGGGLNSQPAFSLWLKMDLHMNITQINAYPTLASAVQVVSTLIYAWASDGLFRGARWPPMIFSGLALIVVNASLAAWNIPQGWHWACYILSGLGGGISGLCFAWAHEICKDDLEERALVTATMNEMAYVVQAWLPLLVWQQVDAPRYQKGSITMVGLNAGLIATALTIRWLHQRELRQKNDKVHDSSDSTEVS